MVLMAEPPFRCVEAVPDLPPTALPAGTGRASTSTRPWRRSWRPSRVVRRPAPSLCGRYEGVDQPSWPTTWSNRAGCSVELASCWPAGSWRPWSVVEAVARLLPEVLGQRGLRPGGELHARAARAYPQYTRPAEFRGVAGPQALALGDHGAVAAWRRTQALLRTAERRFDLIVRLVRASALSPGDVRALAEHGYDVPSGTEPG